MATKKEKAQEIMRVLEDLFPQTPIPLQHKDAYTLLIAVLLSAQCTDERVNKISPLLFGRAHAPKTMAQLEVSQIEEIIRPCGLAPKKAMAISNLSRILVEQHESQVPANFHDLEALPGVGHKTASVVMSQAFGVPAFPVDTHIHRLAFRWGLSNGKNVETTEADLKKLFPKEKWNSLHLQIIFFGRQYCPARGHNPYDCPICSRFGRKSMFNEFDQASQKTAAPKRKAKKEGPTPN